MTPKEQILSKYPRAFCEQPNPVLYPNDWHYVFLERGTEAVLGAESEAQAWEYAAREIENGHYRPDPKQMDTANKLHTATDLLSVVAKQLEQWAQESKAGGWSTHQVDPQQKLASRIYETLGRIT